MYYTRLSLLLTPQSTVQTKVSTLEKKKKKTTPQCEKAKGMRNDVLEKVRGCDMEGLACHAKQAYFYMEGNGEPLKRFKHLIIMSLVCF